jgi:hydroxyacylglutathione hydrolase
VTDPLPVRRAARIILLDPDDRVLLMRYDDGPPNGSHWSTPGGGLNAGEDYPAAAIRELEEETGWNDVVLLGEVHRRSFEMDYGGRLVCQRERFYLARTDQAHRVIRGVEAMHAADGIAAWRWWTPAELESTAETVWPSGLANLIKNVRTRGVTQRFRALAPGVLVATAGYATTNSTVVAADDGGCLVIDPGVSVADIAALAADLAGAGLRPRAGFATHPHWDHVLWSRDLGDVPRYAAPGAVTVAEQERDALVGGVEESAPGHDLGLFGQLVALPADCDAVPWDGPAAQVIIHNGHVPGHAALFLPDTGVLIAGDMLSDIEIPLLDTAEEDPLGDYRTGLQRLAAVSGVRWLVPGHGHIADAAQFRRRLESDARYLDLLAAGRPFDDPRCTQEWLRDWHKHQLRSIAG